MKLTSQNYTFSFVCGLRNFRLYSTGCPYMYDLSDSVLGVHAHRQPSACPTHIRHFLFVHLFFLRQFLCVALALLKFAL